jgi:hypothetical protein
MKKRTLEIIAMCLLAMFFIPFIYKLRELDLSLLLLAGLALPIYEFWRQGDL